MLRPLGAQPLDVDAGQLAGFRVPDQSEQIAAGAVHHGFYQAEYRVSGDGCIHRGSSPRENLRAGLGRKRLRGGHNPAARDDHGTGFRAILSGREGGEGQEDEAEPVTLHEGLFYMKRV